MWGTPAARGEAFIKGYWCGINAVSGSIINDSLESAAVFRVFNGVNVSCPLSMYYEWQVQRFASLSEKKFGTHDMINDMKYEPY